MKLGWALVVLALATLPNVAAKSVEPCGGTDVKVAGSAEGCAAVVVFGKAEGRLAIAGFGRATGGTIAIVGSGCASQNEEGMAIGVDQQCGRST